MGSISRVAESRAVRLDEPPADRPGPALAARRFLFLQGPHGRFFPRLGDALLAASAGVERVNFNGGDRATWPGGTDYRGPPGRWPRFAERLMADRGVTDLVLYGDCRPLHAAAVAVARRLGVCVHVFEEGYIRPDWVTLERNGVNGHSTLPRDRAWYLAQARALPPVPPHAPLPSYGATRGWAAFFYHAEVVLQFWRFPFGSTHRDRDPVWEGIRYLRRFRRRAEQEARTRRDLARLAGLDYVLFPLQLNSDYQIRRHSPFASLHAAVEQVLASFARHAPAHLRLAVKEHPLDSGLIDWRRVVESMAERLGVAARVTFLEAGDLSALVEGSRGMVTVNSTSGTLALAAGKPVKVLGAAVYDVEGITDPQPLDGFWAAPRPPDPATYDAFYRVLADRTLLHGAFLSDEGLDLLVDAAVRRLAHPPEGTA